jgi:hypothetical protein
MRKVRLTVTGLAAFVVLMAFLPGASAATSARSDYCSPTPGLCGSATARLFGATNNQYTGQTSITDLNHFCGITYTPDEEGYVRVWWEDGHSAYFGKVKGTCITYLPPANFTTPVRTGHRLVKFRFLACAPHVINGDYSNCRLGPIKNLP